MEVKCVLETDEHDGKRDKKRTKKDGKEERRQ
jgi:hypothetical protein